MGAAAVGFHLQNLWMLLLALFLMGAQRRSGQDPA